ncbi:MAG: hypothetical protein QNJ00_12810 [Woeseiaceae bacterium]|nr:hypothetical protein [Woeseiaceae bacterium]
MRPLMVINGILLGSCFSIAVSLGLVLIVFAVIGDEYPRVQREIGPLLKSFFIFIGMTAISALSFYAIVKSDHRRHYAQALMWLGVLLTGWYYWP